MKIAKIEITIVDHKDRDEEWTPKQVGKPLRLQRVLPSRHLPADQIPNIVDDALNLLRRSLIKLYTKHRN